ncbi:M48 family metalloprotease [Leptospira wolffii]|uniref:M48 family metalloprotease n=1 Tax=Leptospira wolffii TaxID=409998 RepID=A0ABV5BTJ7_9LEPT
MKKKIRRILFLFLFSFSLTNCGWMVDSFFPLEIDEFLGKQYYQGAIRGEHGTKEFKSEGLRKYVQSITDRILKSPEIRYKEVFPYRVTVLEDDQTINAVCAPGGYIFVYTGLLRFVDDEATLAGILAHEIAHAEKRHSTKQLSFNITLYFILYTVLSYVLGPDMAEHASDIAGFSSGIVGLANSRSAEEEADHFGFEYIRSTPYYPGAIAKFFSDIQVWKKEHMGESEENLPLGKYLSSHPLDEERISENERRLKESGIKAPKKEAFFRDRYKAKISSYLPEEK